MSSVPFKLKKFRSKKMYPYLNIHISLKVAMNLSKKQKQRSTTDKKSSNYVKPLKDIKSQITAMSKEITSISINNMSNKDKLTRLKTDNDFLVTDLHQNIDKSKKEVETCFKDLMIQYTRKGYKISNFTKTSNLFNLNPLLESKKEIDSFYNNKKIKTINPDEDTLYSDEKNFMYLNKLNNTVRKINNGTKNKDFTLNESQLFEKKLKKRKKIFEENIQYSKDIINLQKNIEDESKKYNSIIKKSTKGIYKLKGWDFNQKLSKRKATFEPSFTQTLSNFNKSTLYSKKSTTIGSNFYTVTESSRNDNPEMSKIEKLYKLKDTLNFDDFVRAIEDYYDYENKQIAPLNKGNIPQYFKHTFNSLNKTIQNYNVSEKFKKYYNKLGKLSQYSQLIEQNEKVDNTLGQLGYSYIDKYIAREVL